MMEEFLWVEKYRPQTIEDTILPQQLKDTFQEFVNQGNIPNLLLTGSAGCGKTTVARAMLEQLGCDYIIINGSMNGNIDTLRNEIMQFASSVSLMGGRKYVILDEADYLNCLDENESIKLADGSNIKLKDMQIETSYEVVSFNIENKQFENNFAEVVNKTSKMVYEIELNCGRTIKCTDDHPLICEDPDGNVVTRTIFDGLEGYKIIIQK